MFGISTKFNTWLIDWLIVYLEKNKKIKKVSKGNET